MSLQDPKSKPYRARVRLAGALFVPLVAFDPLALFPYAMPLLRPPWLPFIPGISFAPISSCFLCNPFRLLTVLLACLCVFAFLTRGCGILSRAKRLDGFFWQIALSGLCRRFAALCTPVLLAPAFEGLLRLFEGHYLPQLVRAFALAFLVKSP